MCYMLRCCRSPNLQSNICRKITSQQKPCSLLLKFSAFECFIISTRHFLLELRRMAHLPFFYSHKLFLSCQRRKLYNDAWFPFTPIHLQFQKETAGKFIHYTFPLFLKNWLLKYLLDFLRPCDIFDLGKYTLLKCQKVNQEILA